MRLLLLSGLIFTTYFTPYAQVAENLNHSQNKANDTALIEMETHPTLNLLGQPSIDDPKHWKASAANKAILSTKTHELFTELIINDTPSINYKQRKLAMIGIHAGLYVGSLVVLNEAWYKDYPRGNFRTFNDWGEWLQVDKFGHAWSAFQLSRASYAGWRWTSMPQKKAVWVAGLSGFTFLTVIEILDGFSAEWGWSWGDFGANVLGSGLFIGQNLLWQEERISYKFSFHKMTYNDPQLNKRSDELFGTSLPERMLKDYNGQTYWLSANLKSFMKDSKLPPWLNIAVGYGASGMFGGMDNIWTNETTGQVYNRSDIPRLRQWYLAPDIDFTRIKTNSKWMRSLFYALNAFKMPAPTLVLSNGKLRVHGFYF
jgi:hypothetical protein